MKEFLLLIRQDADALDNLPPEDLRHHARKFAAYIGSLMKEGKLKSAQPLESGGRVVIGRNGVTRDGPFNESKEVVAGYFLILADDIEDAVRVARANPVFQDIEAMIEVRPIRKMEGIN